MTLFSKKTLLLTGCNRGIGKAILTKFTQNGFDVIACVRLKDEDFNCYCKELEKKFNISITIYEMDLSDLNSVSLKMKEIFESKVSIDVLVNNAGVAFGAFSNMTSVSKVKEIFEVNFFAPFLICQYVSKWMQKRGSGVIINLGSVAGLDAMEGYSAYGTSKASLMFYSQVLAKELGKYNIRVNAVAPGLTNTNMANEMERKAGENMIQLSTLKRLGEPKEIADLIYFLSSDAASFITGQVIRIDGGM